MDDAMDIDQPSDASAQQKLRGKMANGYLHKYASNQRLNQTGARPIPPTHGTSSSSTGTRETNQGSEGERNTNRDQNQAEPATTAPATRGNSMSTIDLGAYDGGLEAENMTRGEVVTGEAAQSLALNSSQSRYATHSPCFRWLAHHSRVVDHSATNGNYPPSKWVVL